MRYGGVLPRSPVDWYPQRPRHHLVLLSHQARGGAGTDSPIAPLHGALGEAVAAAAVDEAADSTRASHVATGAVAPPQQ